MPIDNAEKRKAVAGIITGVLPVSVTPNASQDKEWRTQAGWGYSGIPPFFAPSGWMPMIIRRRRRRH